LSPHDEEKDAALIWQERLRKTVMTSVHLLSSSTQGKEAFEVTNFIEIVNSRNCDTRFSMRKTFWSNSVGKTDYILMIKDEVSVEEYRDNKSRISLIVDVCASYPIQKMVARKQ
jgi:hypothetical protein